MAFVVDINIVKSFRIYLLLILLMGIAVSMHAEEISISEINGMVKDNVSTEGLPFASVLIASISDTNYSKGVITDANGKYIIKDIPYGNYKLLASYMGYQQEEILLEISEKKKKLDILLSRKNFDLEEVTISSERELVEQSIKKTTVNVSKDATLTGGTAVDVLQTLPSVDFDINGQIQYRGSDKVTILLNGKKSELVKSLDQIPADQIEKIEIINNPSAKQDAEGMSGIINVVMKSGDSGKNKTTVMLYAGLPLTFGGNVGYSGISKKSSFYVNGGYNYKTRFQTKEHLRKNYEDPSAPDYYQYDNQDENLNDALIIVNYEYSIADNQQISLSVIGSKKFNSAERDIQYQTLENEQTLYESYKEIDISLDNYSFDADLDYQYDFRKKGQKLDASLHYTILDQTQQMDNVYYPENLFENKELQNTDSWQLNKEAIFSLDYAHPIMDSLMFEAGYRFSGKDLLNDFSSESYNPFSDSWENDTALDNRFNYLQSVNAVYVNLDVKFKYFNVQAGLRGEYTTNEQINEQKDEYVNLFPSVTISKKLSSHFNNYLSYNRRINRPTIKMLNPYTNEYADILNTHAGNPDLKPEYVNTFETGTRYVFNKISGSVSLYFRNIDQAISRVKSASNDSALVVTYMNLDNAKLLGCEISMSYKPFDWWSINASGNVFYTELRGEYGPNNIERIYTGWTANITNKFKLPEGIGLQLNAYYRSKLPDVMGTYMERYYLDMAISKNILEDRGKLIFKISDIFNTYRYGLDLVGVDENGYEYSQRNRRKNESQYFILSFIYNIDSKAKQEKKTNFYLESFDK